MLWKEEELTEMLDSVSSPPKNNFKKSINDFNKVLKECNGDRNKAVDHYNKRNEITAEDMRNLL